MVRLRPSWAIASGLVLATLYVTQVPPGAPDVTLAQLLAVRMDTADVPGEYVAHILLKYATAFGATGFLVPYFRWHRIGGSCPKPG